MKTAQQLAELFNLDVNDIEPPVKCGRCGERKPQAEFHRSRSSVNGVKAYCKPCAAAHHKEWRKSGGNVRARLRQ